MKMQNNSSKVIGIGGVYIMPDATVELDEKALNLPAVQTYMRMGLLVHDEGERQKEMEARIRKETEAKLRAEMEAKMKAQAAAKASAKAKAAGEPEKKNDADNKAAEKVDADK